MSGRSSCSALLAAICLFAAGNSFAHNDGNVEADRHRYYIGIVAGEHRTSQEAADAYIAYQGQTACGPVQFTGEKRWTVPYRATQAQCDGGVFVYYLMEERHCPHGQDMYEGLCTTSGHQCVALQNSLHSWTTQNDPPPGFNVPDSLEAESPYFSRQGCSFYLQSSSADGAGTAVTYVQTGSLSIDEDGLPLASHDGVGYDDCIPAAIDSVTGAVSTDWGQTDDCNQDAEDPDPDPDPEQPDPGPDADGPDNDGSDDNETPDPLDEEQLAELKKINSELDEIDSNTERAAYAGERAVAELDEIEDDLDDIKGELEELNECDVADGDLCGDGSGHEMTDSGEGPGFGASNSAFWTAIEAGPWGQALSAQSFSTAGGTCPTAEFSIDFGSGLENFVLDWHCGPIEDFRGVFEILFMLGWIGSAIRVLFSA
jgi:hypothetical protein